MTTRRRFLTRAAALPLAPLMLTSLRKAAHAQVEAVQAEAALPAPKYTLAINLEIMFPSAMPYEERIEQVARCGAKHYAFWGWQGKNLDKMLEAHHKHDLKCVSISGDPKTGWGTGLTKPGAEAAFLADFEECCQVANRFQADNLITFVGAIQPDVPAELQHQQIVAGLKKAGDLAAKHDVYLTLEPLNRVESAQMTMLTAGEAFGYAAHSGHPCIKVDYDMYHRQLGEGNVINNLRLGLDKGHIRFLEVGDVPGRKEPGSGETNYANIFRVLRQIGYSGYIGMEHGTTRTPQYAWDVTRKLAGF